MLDLDAARPLRHSWRTVVGECRRIGEHCWVEADGWAFA
jgi:hypothetical protein